LLLIPPLIPIQTEKISVASVKLGNGELTFLYSGWDEIEQGELTSIVSQAYPLIKEIYGSPAFTSTVTIVKDVNLASEGEYDYNSNTIRLRSVSPILIHELVHAFHGSLINRDPRDPNFGRPIPTFMEEGFAEAVEALVRRKLTSDKSFVEQHLLYYEEWNKRALEFADFYSPLLLGMRYLTAGGMWLKVYFEYNDFFRSFNHLWYQTVCYSLEDFMALVSTVAPVIEGQPLRLWIAKQYVTHFELGGGFYLYPIVKTISENNISLNIICYYREQGSIVEEFQSGNVTLRVYDADDNLITIENFPINMGYTYHSINLSGHSGRIKIVSEIENNYGHEYETSYVYLGKNIGLFGVVLGANSGFLQLQFNNYSVTTPVINGGFQADLGDWEGLVTLTFKDSEGREFKRQLSKPQGNYFTIINTLPDASIARCDLRLYRIGGKSTLTFTVHNTGATNITHLVIKIFDGDPVRNGKQISSDIIVPQILVDSIQIINFTWNAPPGNHAIFVVLDPDDAITESYETNNRAYIMLAAPLLKCKLLWNIPLNGSGGKVTIGDVNGDLKEEIIIGNDKYLYVFHKNGSLMWKLDIPVRESYANVLDRERIVLEDIDGDKAKEIIVASLDNKVYAIKGDGTILWSYNYGTHITSIAVGDITGDGKNEIIVGGGDPSAPPGKGGGPLTLLDSKGNRIWALNQEAYIKDLALGDLNGDGKEEIIMISSLLMVFDSNATLLWSFKDGGCPAFVKVADVNGDGQKEVIVNWGRVIYAIKNDGSLIWRVSTPAFPLNLDIDDVDGDGLIDVIFGGSDLYSKDVYVIRGYDGKVLLKCFIDGDDILYVTSSDVNADGINDVVGITINSIFALNGKNGALLIYYKRRSPGAISGTIVMSDVDEDGIKELIMVRGSELTVFGTYEKPTSPILNPPTLGDITESSVKLTWNQNTDPDFYCYEVYLSTSPGALGTLLVRITDQLTTTYTVTGLLPATKYYFTIRVINMEGFIADSNQVFVETKELEVPPVPSLPTSIPLEVMAAIIFMIAFATVFSIYRFLKSKEKAK
jgi:hypothetical protein